MALNPFQQLIRDISDELDADIFVYIGPIDRPHDDNVITRLKAFKRRRNALLLLTTLGGDPNAAYRIARSFQAEYSTIKKDNGQISSETNSGEFFVFVDTRCKSAGTILATGATKIFMSDYAELGPIDVQLRKGDEVGERSSSLTPMHALESLRDLSIKYFEDCFKELRFNQDLLFATKAASEIASKMSTSLFGNIFSQIDPMRVAEFDRAMRIASEYGERLGKQNLKDNGLTRLVAAYPTHGFVIDRKEAQEIFISVEPPGDKLKNLGMMIRENWEPKHLLADSPLIYALTTPDIFQEDEPSTEKTAESNPVATESV